MSEPGTGKTLVHLVDTQRRIRASGKPTLVLASKSLLEAAWAEDAHRFTPDLNVSVAWAKNRTEALKPGADLYVTNHDAVKDLTTEFLRRCGQLIVDESTAYKHYTSQRSKAAAKIRPFFESCALLTGTATPNGLLDIWHQAYILDGGKRLGRLYTQFRNAVSTPVQTGPKTDHVTWEVKSHAEAAVAARMADCSIRHLLNDCVDMPERIVRTVAFRLSPKHQALYNKMAKDMIVTINDREILAVNGGALRVKLLQIASGSIYGENGAELIESARYELILDLVEEASNSIVVFLWKHQRDELLRQATKRGVSYTVIDGDTPDGQRREIVANYQKGFFRVLFGHPQSMAHGLTLTRGVRTIWASPTVNLEHWEQANRRIFRIGQTQRTETIVVCAAGTQDDIEFRRCTDKEFDAQRLYTEMMSHHA